MDCFFQSLSPVKTNDQTTRASSAKLLSNVNCLSLQPNSTPRRVMSEIAHQKPFYIEGSFRSSFFRPESESMPGILCTEFEWGRLGSLRQIQ